MFTIMCGTIKYFGDTLNQQRLKAWAHLLPFYDVKLHSLSIPNATKIFPWVVLLNGSLDTNQKQSENISSLKTNLVCQWWQSEQIITWWTKTSSFVSFLQKFRETKVNNWGQMENKQAYSVEEQVKYLNK